MTFRRMLTIAGILVLALAAWNWSQAADEASGGKLFPYAYAVDDLPNGLRLVTVPTDYPNMVALYVVVRAGSRDEVEPGKSGYAHLFEHLMFRGSENYTSEQRDALMKRAGADTNASTNQDRTTYYAVFSKEDLDEVMKVEADRFQRLKYTEPAYKTESLAVLGEYNKNSSEPTQKLDEVLYETAFKTHTYAHTTMGYLKAVQTVLPPGVRDRPARWRRHPGTRAGADEEVFRGLGARQLCTQHPRGAGSNRESDRPRRLAVADAAVAGRCVQGSGIFRRNEGQGRARSIVGDRVWPELRPVSPARARTAESRRAGR